MTQEDKMPYQYPEHLWISHYADDGYTGEHFIDLDKEDVEIEGRTDEDKKYFERDQLIEQIEGMKHTHNNEEDNKHCCCDRSINKKLQQVIKLLEDGDV